MSRRTRERWLEAQERWPNLYQFLGAYLHEDWPEVHGSVAAAIDAAVADRDLVGRQKVLREWRDWNASVGCTSEGVASLNDGMGVNLLFKDDVAVRAFMNNVYDKLITSVRAETSKEWKP